MLTLISPQMTDTTELEKSKKPPTLPLSMYYSAGAKYLNLSNYEKALKSLDEAIKIDPTHVNSLLKRSKCYLGMCEYEKAQNDAQRVLELCPKNLHAMDLKGEAQYLFGDFEGGYLTYLEGKRIKPSSDELRLGKQLCQDAMYNSRYEGLYDRSDVINMQETAPDELKFRKLLKSRKNHRDYFGKNAEFFEQLMKDKNLKFIRGECKDIVDYIRQREKFWCMEMPLHSRKKKEKITVRKLIKESEVDKHIRICIAAKRRAEIHLERESLDDCMSEAETLLYLIESIPDEREEDKMKLKCDGYHLVSLAFKKYGNFSQARRYLLKELDIAKKYDFILQQTKVYYELGERYQLSGDIREVVKCVHEVVSAMSPEKIDDLIPEDASPGEVRQIKELHEWADNIIAGLTRSIRESVIAPIVDTIIEYTEDIEPEYESESVTRIIPPDHDVLSRSTDFLTLPAPPRWPRDETRKSDKLINVKSLDESYLSKSFARPDIRNRTVDVTKSADWDQMKAAKRSDILIPPKKVSTELVSQEVEQEIAQLSQVSEVDVHIRACIAAKRRAEDHLEQEKLEDCISEAEALLRLILFIPEEREEDAMKLKCDAYHLMSLAFKEDGNVSDSYQCLLKELEIAHKYDFMFHQTKAYHELGEMYQLSGDTPNVLKCLNKVMSAMSPEKIDKLIPKDASSGEIRQIQAFHDWTNNVMSGLAKPVPESEIAPVVDTTEDIEPDKESESVTRIIPPDHDVLSRPIKFLPLPAPPRSRSETRKSDQSINVNNLDELYRKDAYSVTITMSESADWGPMEREEGDEDEIDEFIRKNDVAMSDEKTELDQAKSINEPSKIDETEELPETSGLLDESEKDIASLKTTDSNLIEETGITDDNNLEETENSHGLKRESISKEITDSSDAEDSQEKRSGFVEDPESLHRDSKGELEEAFAEEVQKEVEGSDELESSDKQKKEEPNQSGTIEPEEGPGSEAKENAEDNSASINSRKESTNDSDETANDTDSNGKEGNDHSEK